MNISINQTAFGCKVPTGQVIRIISAERSNPQNYIPNLHTIETIMGDGTKLTGKSRIIGENILKTVANTLENILPDLKATQTETLDVSSDAIKAAVKWAEGEICLMG